MHSTTCNISNSSKLFSHNPGLAPQSAGKGSSRKSAVLSRRELQRVIFDILG